MPESEKKVGTLPLYRYPWLRNNNPVWLGTTLTLIRNIENFFFPHLLSVDQQKQIVDLLNNVLGHHGEFSGGVMKRGEECQPVDKEYLIEHFLLPFGQLQAFAGVGFLLNSCGSLLSIYNLHNHFMLCGVEKNGEFEKLYRAMMCCEGEVQKVVSYAFSQRFGYLTSQPEMTGCGLRVRALLHLSALIHTGGLARGLQEEAKEGIEISSVFDEKPQEWTQDLVVVQNRFCLGVTEEAILSSVRTFSERLVEKELKKREEIRSCPTPELRDKVSRSFAMLKHSYQMDVKEAMNDLSLIKLGLSLGWIQGVSLDVLNELFFVIRRAHFLKTTQEQWGVEALLHARASFLQDRLKSLELLIH